MRSRTALLVGAGLVALIVGCGGTTAGPTSRATGGACTSNHDCQSTCLTSQTFPKGYCTLTCSSDDQCPAGAACVSDDAGPICEVLCSTVSNDCTAFGPAFACDEKARVAGAAAHVCRSH